MHVFSSLPRVFHMHMEGGEKLLKKYISCRLDLPVRWHLFRVLIIFELLGELSLI